MQAFQPVDVDSTSYIPQVKVDIVTGLAYIRPQPYWSTHFNVYEYIFLTNLSHHIISTTAFTSKNSPAHTVTIKVNASSSVDIFTVYNGIIYAIVNASFIQSFNASTGQLIGSFSAAISRARYNFFMKYGSSPPSQILVDENQNIYVTRDVNGDGTYFLDVFNNSTIIFSEILWMVTQTTLFHLCSSGTLMDSKEVSP